MDPQFDNDHPEGDPMLTPTEESAALMADVEVALAAARIWLVGEYADRPREMKP